MMFYDVLFFYSLSEKLIFLVPATVEMAIMEYNGAVLIPKDKASSLKHGYYYYLYANTTTVVRKRKRIMRNQNTG